MTAFYAADRTRLAFAGIPADEHGESACRFLVAAVAWFAGMNIRIERILTEKGSPFRSRAFRANCVKLGIKHKFTRPYTPRTIGKVEFMIQTLLRE